MGIVFVLVPLTILLALGFLTAFFWSMRRKQFDDLDTPPLRVLFDDASRDKNQGKNLNQS